MTPAARRLQIAVAVLFAPWATAVLAASDTRPPMPTVWRNRCAMCHGKQGVPTKVGVKMGARNFTDPEVAKIPDSDLAGVIAAGKDKMPSFRDQLDDAAIEALVKYIRTLTRPPPG